MHVEGSAVCGKIRVVDAVPLYHTMILTEEEDPTMSGPRAIKFQRHDEETRDRHFQVTYSKALIIHRVVDCCASWTAALRLSKQDRGRRTQRAKRASEGVRERDLTKMCTPHFLVRETPTSPSAQRLPQSTDLNRSGYLALREG